MITIHLVNIILELMKFCSMKTFLKGAIGAIRIPS